MLAVSGGSPDATSFPLAFPQPPCWPPPSLLSLSSLPHGSRTDLLKDKVEHTPRLSNPLWWPPVGLREKSPKFWGCSIKSYLVSCLLAHPWVMSQPSSPSCQHSTFLWIRHTNPSSCFPVWDALPSICLVSSSFSSPSPDHPPAPLLKVGGPILGPHTALCFLGNPSF